MVNRHFSMLIEYSCRKSFSSSDEWNTKVLRWEHCSNFATCWQMLVILLTFFTIGSVISCVISSYWYWVNWARAIFFSYCLRSNSSFSLLSPFHQAVAGRVKEHRRGTSNSCISSSWSGCVMFDNWFWFRFGPDVEEMPNSAQFYLDYWVDWWAYVSTSRIFKITLPASFMKNMLLVCPSSE